MAITKKRLYGHDGVVTVREERTAADAPAAGSWTPDNLNAAEISGGVVADDVTLDAREWEEVYLSIDFVDAAGAPVAGGTVDVDFLLSVPQVGGTRGRRWKVASSVSSLSGDDLAPIPSSGHDCAFRLTAVSLGGANKVNIRVTGGKKIPGV
jgi:hypothetical protein